MAIPHQGVVEQLTPTSRRSRRPQHTYHLRFKPWVIQPYMIAPVLPGETLRSALFQTRAITKPINNSVIGWWFEQYLFYVKLRDLNDRDLLQTMLLVQGTDVDSLDVASANVNTQHISTDRMDWVQMCLRRVIECYFRNQGEAYDVSGSTLTVGGSTVYMAKTGHNSYLESLVTDSGTLGGGGSSPQDGTESLEQLEVYQRTWDLMRQQNVTNLTFEEWLRQYGVRLGRVEEHRPELIRYVRDWTYPANTVDPATGTPTSACSWAISERADKDRFLTEPGFIFGVVVVRPKIYLSKLTGVAVECMTDAISWLPAMLLDNPEMSLKFHAYNAGPVRTAAVAGGYWLDIKDIFMYGDQFVNFALSGTGFNQVALPTSTWTKEYVASTDIDNLFVSTAQVTADGVVSLNIATVLQDTT